MKELIEAFVIFSKYLEKKNPIRCGYEELYVDIPFLEVSEEDRKKLRELGFSEWSENYDEEDGYCIDEDTIFYFIC